jgi:hypothetical protein
MSALENSVFIEILKKTTTFLTYIGDLSLKVLCYTLLGVLRYENY